MVDNKRCIGCGACAEICPHGCITMQQDRYGFFKPVADPAECVRCGLCDRCCPAENRQKKNGVSGAFAAQNKDDSVVRSSSSGGVFSALAGAILKAGGAVYGVELDPSMQPVHTRIDDQKELYRLQGSKICPKRYARCVFKYPTGFEKRFAGSFFRHPLSGRSTEGLFGKRIRKPLHDGSDLSWCVFPSSMESILAAERTECRRESLGRILP